MGKIIEFDNKEIGDGIRKNLSFVALDDDTEWTIAYAGEIENSQLNVDFRNLESLGEVNGYSYRSIAYHEIRIYFPHYSLEIWQARDCSPWFSRGGAGLDALE